jgi:hypothetical protein
VAGVGVITFAPHATQIFQILDVTLLGVLKRRLGYKLPFEDEKETGQFRMKVYRDSKQTTMEINICEAFQAIEFEFDTEAELYRLLFNEEKLRQYSSVRLASSWINCRVGGIMPDLDGSTNKNKVIWLKQISLSLIRYRDMVMCQKTKKWNCGSIPRITWRVLWVFKFFIQSYGSFYFSHA